MRAFIISLAAALVIAVGSVYVLDAFQKTAASAPKIESVRV